MAGRLRAPVQETGLRRNSRIEDEKANSIPAMYRRLFNMTLRVVDSTDPVPRLMPEFPEVACLNHFSISGVNTPLIPPG